jgi:hypothetical protein
MSSFLDNLPLYDSTTQSRGRNYFKEGLVQQVFINAGEVDAEVLGSENYHVHLSFDANHKLIKGSCTCPCQFPCKHQVAVLYQLDEREERQSLSAPVSSDELLSQMKAATRNRDYRRLYQLGLTILIKIGTFSKEEGLALVSVFLANFGTYSYANKFNWADLACKLLIALPVTGKEKTALLYDLVSNRQISVAAQSGMLYAFADQERPAPLYDPAFVRFYNENPLLARSYLAVDLYHYWNCMYLSDDMFVVLLKEGSYLSERVDVLSRLPTLGVSSSLSDIDLYLGIVEYLIKKHRMEEVPKDAIATLEAIGQKKKAAQLAQDLFLEDGSFQAYLAYRPFMKEDEIQSTLRGLDTSRLLSGAKDAILLYESPLGGLPSPKIKTISYADLWLCRARISPSLYPMVSESLVTKLHSSFEARRVDGDCAYGLLLLEVIGAKEALRPFLESERLGVMSLEDPLLRATYLRLLAQEGLLKEKGFAVYGGANDVSH